MDERQRAAWRALALGPVWQRRPDLPVSASTTGLIGVVANDARPGQIASAPVPAPAPAPALPTWAGLRQAVEACAGCQRALSRTVPVFGSGSDQAAWMVVGHQPDSDDDAAGEPYSGAAGQLLERMLEAIGVSRARDVFITQSVKCRAPDDRSPQTGELAACSGHLRHQIGLLRPALILALGPAAARSLLAVETPHPDLRGRAHVWQSAELRIPVVVTHDPSDLLRNPHHKAQAWADLRLARRSAGEAVPPVKAE